MNNNQNIATDLPGENVVTSGGATTGEIVTLTKLHEAGAYFGHKKSTWNPKMKPYISSIKKGVHIIDTVKTKRAIEFAYSIIKKFAEREATFIFVGTRKQAQATIRENALRTNSFYVSERWLGGTLTNNRTIFNSVKRLFELEKLAESNFADYTKKEGVNFSKQLAKLQRNLAGIKNMRSKPQVMIVADPRVDEIAVKEARKLGVKVIGIVDTNADPNMVDIAIPANDDSIKSVTLIITVLADAIAAAKGGRQLFAFQPDDKIVLPEELKSERPPRPEGRFGNRPRFGEANRTRTFGANAGSGATSTGAPRPQREGEAARTFTPRRFDNPAAAPRIISANAAETATTTHPKHEAHPKADRTHKTELVAKPVTHEEAKLIHTDAHASDRAHKAEATMHKTSTTSHSKDHTTKAEHAPKAAVKTEAKKPAKGDSIHDKK